MSSITESNVLCKSNILCHGCQHEFPKMKKCSGCLNVHYCSVACQFKHWPEHKSSCDPHGTNEECPICYDEITNKSNKTITECGHCFHSSCLIKHAILTKTGCPLCRQQLADIPDADSSDSDSSDYDSSDYEEDSSDEEDEDERPVTAMVSRKRTIDHILAEMKRNNITERHLIYTLLTTTFHNRYIERTFEIKEEDKSKDMEVFNVLDSINHIPVDFRDGRTYAAALLDNL
jgi:hypothetical protein